MCEACLQPQNPLGSGMTLADEKAQVSLRSTQQKGGMGLPGAQRGDLPPQEVHSAISYWAPVASAQNSNPKFTDKIIGTKGNVKSCSDLFREKHHFLKKSRES